MQPEANLAMTAEFKPLLEFQITIFLDGTRCSAFSKSAFYDKSKKVRIFVLNLFAAYA